MKVRIFRYFCVVVVVVIVIVADGVFELGYRVVPGEGVAPRE
jgi:hypothetical protein